MQLAGLLGPEPIRVELGPCVQRGVVDVFGGDDLRAGPEAVLMQQLLETALELLARDGRQRRERLGGVRTDGGRAHIGTLLDGDSVGTRWSDGQNHARLLVPRVQDVVKGLVDLLERTGLMEHPSTTERVQLEHVINVSMGPDDRALDIARGAGPVWRSTSSAPDADVSAQTGEVKRHADRELEPETPRTEL